jgi:hypothetical protein
MSINIDAECMRSSREANDGFGGGVRAAWEAGVIERIQTTSCSEP